MKRVLIIIICIVSVILFSIGVASAVFMRKGVIDNYQYTKEQYSTVLSNLINEYETITTGRTNEDYRKIVEKDFGCGFYIYSEKDIEKGYNGKCYAFIRLIQIDDKASGFNYLTSFAHEMIHLTEFIKDEQYVAWKTFKYLYEHDDPEFHSFGVRMGIYVFYNFYPEEYNCTAQIIEYFVRKGAR